MMGEDDFGSYWTEQEYDKAEARAKAEDAAQDLYDQDEIPTIDSSKLTLFEALSLSVWDAQLDKPNYYDWFLDTVRT